MTSYTDVLKSEIANIRKETKAGRLNRQDRIEHIQRVTDDYVMAHANHTEPTRKRAIDNGNEPPFAPLDSQLLEQLSNLILHEELTDTTSNKATATEYPFLSDIQLARRREGAHEAKSGVQKGEAPLKAAASVAQDGRNHSYPTRRKRSNYENIKVDNAAKSRNKERRRKYEEFTKVQPVITYFIAPRKAVSTI